LGRKGFIKKALSRLKDDVIQKKKTAHRRQLHVALASEQVIDTIASNFKLSSEEVLSDMGEYRNIAIHLMKKRTSMTNKEIGELFEGLSFSAVAQANSRFSRKLMNDKILWKRVEEILDKLSHVNRLLPKCNLHNGIVQDW
jgi:chromosomal replication initiation ATPase DnaA